MNVPHNTRSNVANLGATDHAQADAPTAAELALVAGDCSDSLTDTLSAFRALEHLTTPTGRLDSERLAPTRTEMGALLRVLNNDLARQIDAMVSATNGVRAAVRGLP
ncbi:MAG: hypothetical protein U1A81_02125 [Hydrogenophaga sp.]|nr:hypothetical protein [Hydrogenophaga sp.]